MISVERRRRQRGWALVSVLFLTAGAIAHLNTRAVDPQQVIDGLVERIEGTPGKRLTYRYEAAHVAFLPNYGYHLTVYVGSHERFAPARYVVFTRLKGEYSADLMADEGIENVFHINGDVLQDYLGRCQVDLAPFDRLFEERFTTRAPPPAR